jgi:hypothetical protein
MAEAFTTERILINRQDGSAAIVFRKLRPGGKASAVCPEFSCLAWRRKKEELAHAGDDRTPGVLGTEPQLDSRRNRADRFNFEAAFAAANPKRWVPSRAGRHRPQPQSTRSRKDSYAVAFGDRCALQ